MEALWCRYPADTQTPSTEIFAPKALLTASSRVRPRPPPGRRGSHSAAGPRPETEPPAPPGQRGPSPRGGRPHHRAHRGPAGAASAGRLHAGASGHPAGLGLRRAAWGPRASPAPGALRGDTARRRPRRAEPSTPARRPSLSPRDPARPGAGPRPGGAAPGRAQVAVPAAGLLGVQGLPGSRRAHHGSRRPDAAATRRLSLGRPGRSVSRQPLGAPARGTLARLRPPPQPRQRRERVPSNAHRGRAEGRSSRQPGAAPPPSPRRPETLSGAGPTRASRPRCLGPSGRWAADGTRQARDKTPSGKEGGNRGALSI